MLLTLAALLSTAVASGPAGAGSASPATLAVTKQADPRIQAIRALVGEIDAQAVKGEGGSRCSARLPAPALQSGPDQPLTFRAWVTTSDEANVDDERQLGRVTIRVRSVDHTGPDFPLDLDYALTRYQRGEKRIFQFLQGSDRSVGHFSREVRTYFGEDGAPFWATGTAKGPPGSKLVETVTRDAEIIRTDFRELAFPEPRDDDPVKLLGPGGGFEASTDSRPCDDTEATRLLALAEQGATTKADKAFVRRFLPRTKAKSPR